MIWKTWAVVGAVCGVLAAALAGGSPPPHAGIILLVALLVGVATTAVAGVVPTHGGRHVEQRLIPTAGSARRNDRASQSDHEVVQRLLRLIGTRELEWLRIESFAAPWRNRPVGPLRQVALFEASQRSIFEPELADAAGRFTDAAKEFLRVYDAETIVDPLMRDASWRIVGRTSPKGEQDLATEHGRIATQARLRQTAANVCDSRDELAMLAEDKSRSTEPGR